MEWENIKDRRPADNQTVLASINGVYKIARFDAGKNGLIEIATNQFFSLDEALSVYWMDIENPLAGNISF
jgi:hypothetical protein